MKTAEYYQENLQHHAIIASALMSEEEQKLFAAIEQAQRIFVAAAGRSLLMGKAFAMRLMQLGYQVSVLDEVTCPAVTEHDLLLLISGSGTTSGLLAKANKAKQLQTQLALLTAKKDTLLYNMAEIAIVLPIPENRQAGAALFEQAVLLYTDSLIQQIQKQKQLSPDSVMARHANLE